MDKPEEKQLLIKSISEDLRLCIIENCIFIEELISHTLGTILNIEWKESKSFGFSSSALSFNQKMQIVSDIKGLTKPESEKLITLMNIRNKFAHMSEIQTFASLFSLTKVGEDIKKKFEKWYFDDKGISDIPETKHETVLRWCFYMLVHQIAEILLRISGEHMFELGKIEGKKQATELLNQELLNGLKKLDGGQEFINEIYTKVEIELKK